VDSSQVVTVEDSALRVWDVLSSTAQQVSAAEAPSDLGHFWTAALHPTNPKFALAAGGSSIQLWDLSSMSSSGGISNTHKLAVRDASWAPHNEYRFVTGGDDGKLRFWDTRWACVIELCRESHGHRSMCMCATVLPRRCWCVLIAYHDCFQSHVTHHHVAVGVTHLHLPAVPLSPPPHLLCHHLRLLQEPEALLELSGHTHWVWQVAYSPFHDPLLASSSTDTTTCVWFTPALAKARGVDAKAAAGKAAGANRCVAAFCRRLLQQCRVKCLAAACSSA
jgi:hypothetical protein